MITAWRALRASPDSASDSSWSKARTAVMTVAGFAFLDYAAWLEGVGWGCAAIGVSLLILESLGEEKPSHGAR